MKVALNPPKMTREQFFPWAQAQNGRCEFDGVGPVAMVGGTINHNQIGLNIHRALYARLKGGTCRPLGPDAGVATIGDAIRYPDALIACGPTPGDALIVPGVVVVFEVVSPSSSRTDRIVKVREYQAVSSILRYLIVESATIGVTVLARASGDLPWIATTLTTGDDLQIPEVGIEIRVDDLYEAVDFPDSGDAA
jgi:Uma2 family endonuclease